MQIRLSHSDWTLENKVKVSNHNSLNSPNYVYLCQFDQNLAIGKIDKRFS